MNQRGKIYLGGGGNEQQSFKLDCEFVGELGDGQILYLPIAQEGNHAHYQSCLEWFCTTMRAHNVANERVVMWTDLSGKSIDDFMKFSGIYIGGGMTGRLCRLLFAANGPEVFSEFLRAGKPIYEGSAGAIALCETLDAVPEELEGTDENSRRGLGVVKGVSLRCHFAKSDRDVEQICIKAARCVAPHALIALPEASGLVYEQKGFRVVGDEPVTIISPSQHTDKFPGSIFST